MDPISRLLLEVEKSVLLVPTRILVLRMYIDKVEIIGMMLRSCISFSTSFKEIVHWTEFCIVGIKNNLWSLELKNDVFHTKLY